MHLLWTVAILAWVISDCACGLDWQNEVNVSMCSWAQFRANIIRDTIYLDGGALWWEVGYSDGSYNQDNDGNLDGLIYTLNLGQPFNQTTNLTSLFQTLSKTGGLASNNIAPNYVDGVMFANDDELITYGGLMSLSNSSSPPAADSDLGYEAYEYGPSRQSWSPGFIAKELPANITRYITNGAGVSAPSENMGYYFSGMRAADWGPIYYDIEGSADTLASTLISVNMTVMRDETWSNQTLPSSVPARANAELAWVPVGENGLLVAVGGVIDPASLTAAQGLNTSQANTSSQVSPTFMETVSIYDITSQEWHLQNTTGDIPPQLTMFCSVVAPAQDGSSFNIYIYGGYNGINQSSIPSDDVYILSVPQMVWTHAYTGQSNHGRSGHECIRVYPDQMMVLGGAYAGNPIICLDGGIIEVFNLNNLEFQDSYDPRVWNEYVVPDAVTANIGGNGNGSATVLAPSSLSSLFATEYTKTIATYYPYALQTPNVTSTPSSTPEPTTITIHNNSGGLPAWVGPVLGVVLGLIVIAAAVIFFLLWRRRRTGRGAGGSETPTNSSKIKGFVLRWLYGTTPQDEKGQTEIGADDIDGATVVSSKTHERHISEAGSVGLHEMEGPGTPIYELGSNTQGPNWGDMHWSQPQGSSPLVSPTIDEMMSHSRADGPLPTTGPIVETATTRHTQRYMPQASNPSSGHRSDESNISEIGSSDSGRPLHNEQVSDNSVSISASQDGSSTEVSNREQTATVVTVMRNRIHTVHEVDELGEIGPLDESSDVSRRQRNLTELE